MRETDIAVTPVQPEHEPQVLDLLAGLWKSDAESRARLFRWKFRDNPSSDGPMGIVAMHGQRVVGFRGYFANRFVVDGDDGRIGVLHPGDTCVDPVYRNRGLSVAMGRMAARHYESRYRLFLNTTCSSNSLPGYLKMGFRPIAQKIRLVLRQPGLIGLLHNRKAQFYWPWPVGRIEFGTFGNVVITDRPRPAAMASAIACGESADTALRLVQDEAFLAWRYRNPVRRYVFYFLMGGDVVRAYVCVSVARNNLSAEILDYGARDDDSQDELFDVIVRRGDFAVLSVFSYGLTSKLRALLDRLGFTAASPLHALTSRVGRRHETLPLLLRPVSDSLDQRVVRLGGADIFNLDNWHLKPVCQDGA